MKYTRGEFNEELYLLWEERTLQPAPNGQSYSVKYCIGGQIDHASIVVKARNFREALEQACYSVAITSSLRPEDIDLHSVYDSSGNLLWGDELAYALVQGKYDASGMSRRDFLTAFGLSSAALLFGVRPKAASAATSSVSLAGTASSFSFFSDDVFSTYLYTGSGASQTIINGINLAGEGGLVWTKNRNTAGWNNLVDSVRGRGYNLYSNSTEAVRGQSASNASLTSFNSNGFSLGSPDSYSNINDSSSTLVAWSFRKAVNFFSVATWVGDNTYGKVVAHDLGATPGLIIVKNLSNVSDWFVLQTSSQLVGRLNATDTFKATGITTTGGGPLVSNVQIFGNGSSYVPPTATNFVVGCPGTGGAVYTNALNNQYVAYLFAHDPSANGVIQCGSFTTDGSGNAAVNLGWEPQFLMTKTSSRVESWRVFDAMRGLYAKPMMASSQLYPDSSSAEYTGGVGRYISSTGFEVSNDEVGSTHIYLAIRRPNKPPTVGTQVYNAIARTATGSATKITGVGFAPDLCFTKTRNSSGNFWLWADRLRGVPNTAGNGMLYSNTSQAEGAGGSGPFITSFESDGISVTAAVGMNLGGETEIHHFFRRAPGFFDVVCYTGVSSGSQNVPHSLGVAPELALIKCRSTVGSSGWAVSCNGVFQSFLNSTSGNLGGSVGSSLTSTYISVGAGGLGSVFAADTYGAGNTGWTYVAYLFATLPGISKVGSYTGNGGSLNIDCGFTTGARFILVRRTNSSGDWYIWDTARGIGTGNDPHLSLNTTAAEVSDDSIDPDNTGFIVNQIAATNINVSGATYMYLAIA